MLFDYSDNIFDYLDAIHERTKGGAKVFADSTEITKQPLTLYY